MSEAEAAAPGAEPAEEEKARGFPHPLALLVMIILAVSVGPLFIPG